MAEDVARDERRLVVAGDHQAEYQTWLSLTSAPEFVCETLTRLHAAFPSARLTLKYLPPNAPLDRLLAVSSLQSRLRVRRHRRPLMKIDTAEATASLQKKSNKSRINRLKRIGEVTLERITDAAAFESVFDEIIAQYDFRQAALNNVAPFREDPCKRLFHVELLRRDPSLLHVTALKVAGNIVAAHIGVVSHHQVHLSIVAHSPTYGPYSPGKLLLLFLGKRLGEEGIHYLDLTPGGDPWKERFADQHDEVHELDIWRGRAARHVALSGERAYAAAKYAAALVGIQPRNVKSLLRTVAELTRAILRTVSGSARHTRREIRLFSQPPGASPLPIASDVRKDSVSDLLDFTPPDRLDGTERFFADALHRLENGEHVYTLVRNGRLRQYAWVNEDPKNASPAATYGRFQPPEGSALLYDVYADPRPPANEPFHAPLARALGDIRTAAADRPVFVALPADSTALHDMKAWGLRHEFSASPPSAWERLRTRWKTGAASGAGDDDRGDT